MEQTRIAAGWRALLVCPDCMAVLLEHDGQLQCDTCSRSFECVGEAINLLPAGAETPVSRYISGLDDSWKRRFIEHIYARHNLSPIIVDALARVVGELDDQSWGLNLGSGNSAIHPRLINLDITLNVGVHVLGDAHRLPIQSDSLSCVISQEVLEHLPSPRQALAEAHRVLRPTGTLFLQVPFIIGTHSLPHDYWRFSTAGLNELVSSCGFEAVECGAAGGVGTSMYRVSTEFTATVAASIFKRAYMPTKALAALLLSPLRLFDRITRDNPETNRIPPGVYCIARKAAARSATANLP